MLVLFSTVEFVMVLAVILAIVALIPARVELEMLELKILVLCDIVLLDVDPSIILVLLRKLSLRFEKILLELSKVDRLIVVDKRLLLVMLRFVMIVLFTVDDKMLLLVMVLLSSTLLFENVLTILELMALRRSRLD